MNRRGDMPTDILALAEPCPSAVAEPDADGDKPRGKGKRSRDPSQAEQLLELAAGAELFHNADGETFADVHVSGHRETIAVAGGLRAWLRREYHNAGHGAPNEDALQSALSTLGSRAEFDGPERRVFYRVGELDGRLYLDLGDPTWRSVEVDPDGWRIVATPPVRFRRVRSMHALPVPTRGGSIEDLRRFVNVRSDDDWTLVVAWLLAALRPTGPYPMLVLNGEQGTAKSTLTRLLRSLVDPFKAPVRAFPRDERDLAVSADNAHVLAFDNVSAVNPWLSDALCRVSTGGGFAVREHYKDRDEAIFDAMRPMILNGIDGFVTRADLADRAIVLTLEPIAEGARLTEAELWAGFEDVRPGILGALLDAVATGLRNLPSIRLATLPRMADFALWATACEPALWPPGTFERAYSGNRAGTVESTLDGDPVAAGVRKLAQQPGGWEGTATELLATLAATFPDPRAANLPKSPRGLADKLRRLAPFLRAAGVGVETGLRVGAARTRMVRIAAL